MRHAARAQGISPFGVRLSRIGAALQPGPAQGRRPGPGDQPPAGRDPAGADGALFPGISGGLLPPPPDLGTGQAPAHRYHFTPAVLDPLRPAHGPVGPVSYTHLRAHETD